MTLKEYEEMREKVEKGRIFLAQIEALKHNIERISEVENVYFYNVNQSIFNSERGNLTDQMKQAYIDAAEEEIKLLEQEFAEL